MAQKIAFSPSKSAIPSSNGESNQCPAHLLEACRKYLLMVANRSMRPELKVWVAASDLVQETINVALRDFEQFRGTSDKELHGWLTKILSNRMADAVRDSQRQKNDIRRQFSIDDEARAIELSLTDSDGTPSAHVMAQEESRRVHDAINQLDEESRQVIFLRNWEKLPFHEIGRQLGISEAGARKRWTKALAKLRPFLNKKP